MLPTTKGVTKSLSSDDKEVRKAESKTIIRQWKLDSVSPPLNFGEEGEGAVVGGRKHCTPDTRVAIAHQIASVGLLSFSEVLIYS